MCESAIRLGLSVTAGILTLIPATTAIGVGMNVALGAYGVANAVTGKNLVTSKELSGAERAVKGVTGTGVS
ncbi:hypothetical protein Hs30E_20600 [Lactococcus hodotermopsidis]|uniref:Pre-toxin TG domain-containing protein n=1 Tax=Pseudolactococcus hodotermopsidis TaxID=2709157 RepID=A0A6A0BDI4_9LACT|nr:pre-toxin TG domain-containing protein [Lactococcus hodotermopsidis]GFH43499.1 hypothetical protein Hs30E_20600 [Lactococcus hodotermopsidis]